MSSVVTQVVWIGGVVTGWELTKALAGAPWGLVRVALRQSKWKLAWVLVFRRSEIESARVVSEDDGWDLAQRRAVRLVRLQTVVRGALPADPELDSPYQRELREAAFGD